MKRGVVTRTRPGGGRTKAGSPNRAKFYLTYPKALVKEPLIYKMAHAFDVVFNVRSASVSEEIGIIALEIDGTPDVVERVVSWFREQGVTVEPIEKNVIE
jgi:ABC-type methionine transport system ATPase subunit